jgi:hypothetical protein
MDPELATQIANDWLQAHPNSSIADLHTMLYLAQLANPIYFDRSSVPLAQMPPISGNWRVKTESCPLVAAAIVANGGSVNSVTLFSSPEWDAEIRSYLQGRGLTASQIDSIRLKVDDYTFNGDAIRNPLVGEVFANRRLSPGTVLFEDYSTIAGGFAPVLVKDGIRAHSATLMADILAPIARAVGEAGRER